MKKVFEICISIGITIVLLVLAVYYAPGSFWIKVVNFSEGLLFQRNIAYTRFNVPESWFELRRDVSDARITALVVEDFQVAILEYLNTNGSVEQLKNELNAVPGILSLEIQQVDFSNDGSQEVVIAIEFLRRGKHASFIWVFGKIDNIYKVLFETGDTDWLIYDPKIILINDINNDGIKEVVASTMWIGSEKEIKLYILTQHLPSQRVTNLFSNNMVPLGDVEISIHDVDNHSVKEITLVGYIWHNGIREKAMFKYNWDGNYYDLDKTYAP